MSAQSLCPHCGHPLVSVCQNCGASVPAFDHQRLDVWPRNLTKWALWRIGVLWFIGTFIVCFLLLTIDRISIGAALPMYLFAVVGIPWWLVVLTRKWLSARKSSN